MNGSVSWVLDLQLLHFAVQTQVLWAFKDTSCLFSESVFSPEKNISLSLICQITFLCLTVCQRGQATACTVLSAWKKKRLHLWETNQPFPNYMPPFRQIKPLINAAILEAYCGCNSSFTCFDSVRTCYKKGRIDDIFTISSAYWKNPLPKTSTLRDQKFSAANTNTHSPLPQVWRLGVKLKKVYEF